MAIWEGGFIIWGMDIKQQVAPYGAWRSPITADLIAVGTAKLDRIAVDGDDVFWLERRPFEGGRNALVQRNALGQKETLTPAGMNVRSRVHEYGGGEFTVHRGQVYFSDYGENHLYRQYPGMEPEVLTLNPALRYADMVVDEARNRLICVREDHLGMGEAVNTLVAVSLDFPNDGEVLVGGNDFYSTPRLSPDGQQLLWLAWNHPNMPWDGCKLWLADIDEGGNVAEARWIAGNEAQPVFQPMWGPDGRIYFVAELGEWWNLYVWHEGTVKALCPMAAEFGRPQWGFNMATFGLASATDLVCTYTQKGFWYLAHLDVVTGTLTPIELPYNTFSYLTNVVVTATAVYLAAGSGTEPNSLIRVDWRSGDYEVIQREIETDMSTAYLSVPQAIEFPTTDNETAHAFYYAPKNEDYVAPTGEKPPLLVIGHGGPTSTTKTHLDWNIQYWTSRGFGVVDVNYRGSTGYGRDYRQQLNGRWGVVDTEDCIAAARYLVAQGEADPERLAIRGGSAGGYTTLCALAFHDVFGAGASYFGIGDLKILAEETHKFESRYMGTLVGSLSVEADVFKVRSPVHFAEQIRCPLILFQGLEDKVVPPNQSEMMFRAVRDNGVPVAYVVYEGEGHGFRSAGNIKHSLEAELFFYSRVFDFELSGTKALITIENL